MQSLFTKIRQGKRRGHMTQVSQSHLLSNLGIGLPQDLWGPGARGSSPPNTSNNEAVLHACTSDKVAPRPRPALCRVDTFPLRSEPGGVVTSPGLTEGMALSLVQFPSLKRVSVELLTVGIKQEGTQHKSCILGLGLSDVPHPSCQVLLSFKD